MGQGDQEEQGRHLSLFSSFCGVLSGSVSSKTFQKVLPTEEMNVPLQVEHLSAAPHEEWYHSNVHVTLVSIFLPLLLCFLLLASLGLHLQHEAAL